MKILVVDDERDVQSLFEQRFRKEIKAYFPTSAVPAQEKFTQSGTKDDLGGESLFGLGGAPAAQGATVDLPAIKDTDAKAFLLRFGKVAKGEKEKFVLFQNFLSIE